MKNKTGFTEIFESELKEYYDSGDLMATRAGNLSITPKENYNGDIEYKIELLNRRSEAGRSFRSNSREIKLKATLSQESFEKLVNVVLDYRNRESTTRKTVLEDIGSAKVIVEDGINTSLRKMEVELGEHFVLREHKSRGEVSELKVYLESGDKDANRTREELMAFLGQFVTKGPIDNDVDSTLNEEHLRLIRQLDNSKEIEKHIQDGDECLRNELTHPALGSYLHATEWILIELLDSKTDVDILKEERNGNDYYFYEIVNKAEEEGVINFKIADKLREYNRSLRSWVAHHKDGDTLREDVQGLRKRIERILDHNLKS